MRKLELIGSIACGIGITAVLALHYTLVPRSTDDISWIAKPVAVADSQPELAVAHVDEHEQVSSAPVHDHDQVVADEVALLASAQSPEQASARSSQ